MSNALALVYAFGGVIFIALMGLFWGWVCKPPVVTLRDKSARNPMTDGCEMDAGTLGTPAEHSTDARPHFIGHGGGL